MAMLCPDCISSPSSTSIAWILPLISVPTAISSETGSTRPEATTKAAAVGCGSFCGVATACRGPVALLCHCTKRGTARAIRAVLAITEERNVLGETTGFLTVCSFTNEDPCRTQWLRSSCAAHGSGRLRHRQYGRHRPKCDDHV